MEVNDPDESLEDLEKSTEWIFQGYFLFIPTDGAQIKLMKRKFGQWWNSNIYLKFLSQSSTWQFFMIQLQNPTEMI